MYWPFAVPGKVPDKKRSVRSRSGESGWVVVEDMQSPPQESRKIVWSAKRDAMGVRQNQYRGVHGSDAS
jgi:hypothetical protein